MAYHLHKQGNDMAKLKVTIDPENKHVQIYGTYRYCTELDTGTLSRVSKRLYYPTVLSRGRKENCILEAIKNLKSEYDARDAAHRAEIAAL